jgi:hypothetical protein
MLIYIAKEDFAIAIKDDETWMLTWLIWEDPKCSHMNFIEGNHQRGHMTMEAEIGVIQPQAKGW